MIGANSDRFAGDIHEDSEEYLNAWEKVQESEEVKKSIENKLDEAIDEKHQIEEELFEKMQEIKELENKHDIAINNYGEAISELEQATDRPPF